MNKFFKIIATVAIIIVAFMLYEASKEWKNSSYGTGGFIILGSMLIRLIWRKSND